MNNGDKALNYSDIYLIPNYSELRSRSQANISVEFLGRRFAAPWLPANMQAVVNQDVAKWLSENDYFYIMHRFGDTKAFVEKANKEKWKTISISVGVKQVDKDLIEKICLIGSVHFITVDVAQSNNILVKEMINHIKYVYNNAICPKIIAGNVATPEAVVDLAEWGADAVKVGIGGSGVCTTKNMTGFHVPMFSCVKDCYEFSRYSYLHQYDIIDRGDGNEIPIIADGGIRDNGDIAKALVAGASLIMAGGMFAACIDAPGENIYSQKISSQNEDRRLVNDKIIKKRYYGSASFIQKGHNSHVEGISSEIECNGLTYAEKYQELKESLQSAISYAGGLNLDAFKNVKWVTTK